MAQSQLEFLRIHQIGNTDAVTGGLIHVSRANPFAGSPDLVRAFTVFFQCIQQHMIWHDDMGTVTDHQILGVKAVLMNIINFLDQGFGINDHSVTDYASLLFIKYT
ncbi:hypothetical protein D3C73_818980 [compost metagenome]